MKRLRIQGEDGIALVMALGVLMVLTIVGLGAIELSTSSSRHVYRSRADQKAYSLAEAGLNNALSQLANKYSTPQSTAGDSSWMPASGSPTTISYSGGTVYWWGSWDGTSNKWTVYGKASVKNPANPGSYRTKTLQADVNVNGSTGLSGAYAYGFFMGDPNTCTTFENGTVIKTSIYIAGCLNLVGDADIVEPDLTKHTIGIHVGKDLSLANSSTNVGTFVGSTPTWAIASANIVGTVAAPSGACIYASVRQACGTSSYVYAQSITRTTNSVPMPTYDIDTVYAKASGKWKDAVCSTGTQPFETD